MKFFLIFCLFFQVFKIYSQNEKLSGYEKILIRSGMVDLWNVDSTIKVFLRYSTDDNFLGADMYGDFIKCYLQKDVAEKLKNAQKLLKKKFPEYSLLVYDAVRPVSIQRFMWDMCQLPIEEKKKYLAHPNSFSVHNYGAAVDLTIADKNGKKLDMGTEFDFFGELSQPCKEKRFLKEGKLSQKQIDNRLLLRKTMQKAGFYSIRKEWWHFNSCWIDEAKKKYTRIENHFIKDSLENESLEEFFRKKKIVYKVQILTSKKKIPENDNLFGYWKVFRYFHKNLYKYTVGEFSNLEKARKFMRKLRKSDFKNAFIVVFIDGKRN